jgi:cytochrome c biogenesis protein CcmG, thiol:disulfide interchange protein DsbE
MTVRQQWSVVLGVIAALAVGLWAATRLLGNELYPVAVGSSAPPFVASTVTDQPQRRSLQDYRGQVVLLNVWATWCTSCKEEIPSLVALNRDFGPRGLKIVAVSIDEGADAAPRVRAFMEQYGVSFDVLHDPTAEISRKYQVTGVPENFVIGPDGIIRKKAYVQDWNSAENRALIARLLEESRRASTAPQNAPAAARAFAVVGQRR